MSLAVTLISVVFMHILCNILRIFLGVLVVVLVGEQVIKSDLTLFMLIQNYDPPTNRVTDKGEV